MPKPRRFFRAALVAVLALLPIASVAQSAPAGGKVSIYLVRHGKTMFNVTGQVQGWSDSPLTEEGKADAGTLAKGLADVPFVAAYSSDLGRARDTADILLSSGTHDGLSLHQDPRLREWNYGGFEGRDGEVMWAPIFSAHGLVWDNKWTQWKDLTKQMSDKDIADTIHKNDTRGWAEDYDQISNRLRAGLDDIVTTTRRAGGGDVLVVSHGSAIQTMAAIASGGTAHGSTPNYSVTIIEYENGAYHVKDLGDMGFFEKGKAAE